MEARLDLAGLVFRKPKFSPEQLRKAKITRNPNVKWELAADGSLLLEAPLADQGKGFAAWLAKRMQMPDTKKFELEPVGGFLWELFDGNHTVETISRKLKEEYKMNRIEADASLNAFLTMLAQRRLITILIPTKKK
ncbi:hypothetical protein BH11ARM1_BH11ARM1_08810 [soil metagenome]